MKKFKKWFLISIIIISSLFIYVYKLDKIPSGVYVDEAAISYNAISILKTGKDEYGMTYPILFRLFGSYTPSLYIYIAAFAFKIFGAGIVVTRMISVLSALGSIYIFYLLITKLEILKYKYSKFIAAFFYAISPWLIFNARLGYETTLGYFIFLTGIYFTYKALHSPKNLIVGLGLLALSTYAAHTQKLLFFIYVFFYFLIFGIKFIEKKQLKILITSLALTVLVFIPYIFIIKTQAFWVKNLNFFDQEISQIFENFFLQILIYYSPKTLFFALPDIDLQHTIPQLSIMYNWMVIPYLLGLYLLIKNRKTTANKFIIFLFFVTVIPASLSGRFISIQRALPFLVPLMLVIGYGIDFILQKFGRIAKIILFFLFTIYSLLNLFRGYFILFPRERALAWNWGYDQVSDFIKNHPEKKFTIDNSRNPRLYIELLYLLDYPPDVYQTEVDPRYKYDYYDAQPQIYKYRFGNIEVRNIDWGADACQDKIIIGDPLSVSDLQIKEHYLEKIYQINDFWQEPVFIFYQTGNKPGC